MKWIIENLCEMEFILLPDNYVIGTKCDVVVTSLFKMDTGYKNFNKYMNGLKRAIDLFNTELPELKFMLLIDNSILNNDYIYSEILKMNNSNMFIIKYGCEIAYANNPTQKSPHIELFGSMMRFVPFFNFDDNFTQCVICIDADTEKIDLNNMYKFLKDNAYIQYLYDTNPFYELLAKWSSTENYTILAGRNMCRYKFDVKLLTEYVNCVKKKNCRDMENIHDVLDFKKYNYYPYGIDEYFLNRVLLKYMMDNNITYAVYVRYTITAPLKIKIALG